MTDKSIWEEVKANSAKRKACKLHRIDPKAYKFGRKVTCLNCTAWMAATDLMYYVEGYQAAGGDPSDVWPGWENKK